MAAAAKKTAWLAWDGENKRLTVIPLAKNEDDAREQAATLIDSDGDNLSLTQIPVKGKATDLTEKLGID